MNVSQAGGGDRSCCILDRLLIRFQELSEDENQYIGFGSESVFFGIIRPEKFVEPFNESYRH